MTDENSYKGLRQLLNLTFNKVLLEGTSSIVPVVSCLGKSTPQNFPRSHENPLKELLLYRIADKSRNGRFSILFRLPIDVDVKIFLNDIDPNDMQYTYIGHASEYTPEDPDLDFKSIDEGAEKSKIYQVEELAVCSTMFLDPRDENDSSAVIWPVCDQMIIAYVTRKNWTAIYPYGIPIRSFFDYKYSLLNEDRYTDVFFGYKYLHPEKKYNKCRINSIREDNFTYNYHHGTYAKLVDPNETEFLEFDEILERPFFYQCQKFILSKDLTRILPLNYIILKIIDLPDLTNFSILRMETDFPQSPSADSITVNTHDLSRKTHFYSTRNKCNNYIHEHDSHGTADIQSSYHIFGGSIKPDEDQIKWYGSIFDVNQYYIRKRVKTNNEYSYAPIPFEHTFFESSRQPIYIPSDQVKERFAYVGIIQSSINENLHFKDRTRYTENTKYDIGIKNLLPNTNFLDTLIQSEFCLTSRADCIPLQMNWQRDELTGEMKEDKDHNNANKFFAAQILDANVFVHKEVLRFYVATWKILAKLLSPDMDLRFECREMDSDVDYDITSDMAMHNRNNNNATQYDDPIQAESSKKRKLDETSTKPDIVGDGQTNFDRKNNLKWADVYIFEKKYNHVHTHTLIQIWNGSHELNPFYFKGCKETWAVNGKHERPNVFPSLLDIAGTSLYNADTQNVTMYEYYGNATDEYDPLEMFRNGLKPN